MFNNSQLVHGLYREGSPIADRKAPDGPIEQIGMVTDLPAGLPSEDAIWTDVYADGGWAWRN